MEVTIIISRLKNAFKKKGKELIVFKNLLVPDENGL